ncbi:FecR domain-containing protein [Hymenobacter sp. BRD128]|uniref:FecR family protein n=1 Tax=Hymenobacter sp. BRD128 TaxID=2675878 RepID=UPI0015655AAB|nr:FecR domain-containing protein [Hymenobacter sp. BRD128]QKG55309.1 FecR domain-containing protein [Hymenobacter sp. BRD128]
MSLAITQELVSAYTAGTTTAAEAEVVRAWLAQPANQLLAQHWMQLHWEALAAAPTLATFDDEPDYEALLRRTRLHLVPAAPRYQAAPTWRRWAAAAGLAATLAGGGWLFYSAHRAPAPLAVATDFGQTRGLTLPDGSQVTLNGHSTLHYATTWQPDQPREVWLDGEGFFSVQHMANNQRFLVHTTAGLQVEVLGTKFVVARRRDQTRVVLLQGKVRVEFDDHQQPDVILHPGELVETHDDQPALVTHKKVHTAPYAAWKDAQLVLDETTIAELATRLHDTYGLDVEVTTPGLNRRRVTGTVPVSDLPTLLQALEETFHLQASRQGNRLTLAEQQ